jgi:dTDP-4-dehydrorhamnose 3,5-epimerase
MKFLKTVFSGLFIIQNEAIIDNRGFFSRTYCKKEFESINVHQEFVQSNHSFNLKKGTLRGMHYQISPFSETKLIRCVEGSLYDVVIDLRAGSSTFLNIFTIELSKNNMKSLLIPEGFAHGYQSLENNTSLIYQHTNYYDQNSARGIRFDDPILNIFWPIENKIISQKDLTYNLIDKNFKGI